MRSRKIPFMLGKSKAGLEQICWNRSCIAKVIEKIWISTMPKIETRFCDECAHAGEDAYGDFLCSKGHKPRFYKPRTGKDGYLEFDWGYKRRCLDFEPVGENK